jgi:hypothetical protein
VEDDHGYFLRVLYEFVYSGMESLGGQVLGPFDMTTAVVIVPDVNDEVVFARLFVALYYLRQLLFSAKII